MGAPPVDGRQRAIPRARDAIRRIGLGLAGRTRQNGPPCLSDEESSMAVPTRPEGFHSVTPYLVCDGAAAAIEFYARAFGATETFRMPMGDKVGHAEIMIGDSHVMLSDEWPDMNLRGPKSRGGPTASLMVYVDDVDAMFKRAVAAGAVVERGIENQFWGDRTGTVVDPFGHRWMLATHVEEVPPEEIGRRMAEWSKQGA
jgi:PhnB protein